jgi:hypothetical protein
MKYPKHWKRFKGVSCHAAAKSHKHFVSKLNNGLLRLKFVSAGIGGRSKSK